MKKRIGKCNSFSQFGIPSEHTLDACGKPSYNVQPTNVKACNHTPIAGCKLCDHELRIFRLEKAHTWKNLDL